MNTNRTDDQSELASGDLVELTAEPPDYAFYALSAGDRGIVSFTDSLGTVHVLWENGIRVGIIAEVAHMLRKVGDSR